MYKGKTFIISGPSGVGKSTVLKELFQDRDDLYFSVSATTRPPRPGEVDGVHYHFTDVDEFRKMISEDAFLEYAEYVGNFYGTPKKFVDEAMEQGKDVVLDIEVQGALQVVHKRPDVVRIFIAPPSWQALEERLTSRGTDSPEKVQKRLVRAKVELQTANICAQRLSSRPPTLTIISSSTTRWNAPCARSTPSCSPSTASPPSAWLSCLNKFKNQPKRQKEVNYYDALSRNEPAQQVR